MTGETNTSALQTFLCSDGIPIPTNVPNNSFFQNLLKNYISTVAALASLVVLTNAVVFLTILTTKSLRSKTYYKGIACMNTLDFLTGAVFIPICCILSKKVISNEDTVQVCLAYRLALTVGFMLCGLTLNSITFLSFESTSLYKLQHIGINTAPVRKSSVFIPAIPL